MHASKQNIEFPRSGVHHRFRSSWEDNTLVIDVSHHQAAKKSLVTYNLDAFTLALEECDGLYRGILPLTKFPSLTNSIKLAVNKALYDCDKGTAAAAVSLTINHSIRILIWTLREGHYTLATLSREDVGRFAVDLANHGWWKLLRYDEALQKLMAKMLRDKTITADLISQNSNVNKICIRVDELVRHLGLPISSSMIPFYFREFLASTSGIQRPVTEDGSGEDELAETDAAQNALKDSQKLQRVAGTYSEFRSTLRTFNRLALHDNTEDSLSFLPFSNVEAECNIRIGDFDGRTINLPVNAVVAVFSESLRWLYDYQEAVIEILNTARFTLEEHRQRNLGHDTGLANTIRERVISIAAQHNLPNRIINPKRRNNNIPATIVDIVFSAMAALIATNQGRRTNEVVGQGCPYGLYFGCTKTVSETISERRLTIYCEKSPQDWGVQWCNRLVADAIDFLERIAQEFRPLNASPLEANADETEARQDKLFQWRYFTTSGFENPPMAFDWRNQSELFFELAGVDSGIFYKSPFPFRRSFIILNVHRYDNPDLVALGNHVGHLSSAATEIYFSDSNKREPSQRVGRLFRKIEEGEYAIPEMLVRERKKYLTEKILDLFSGKPLGGAFPRLVFALTKRLNSSLGFRISSPQEKAETVGTILVGRGYVASEKQNGPCMAGTARHTKRHANCLQDGELRTELASPKKCHGCVHHAPTANTLLIFEKDRNDAAKKSTDFALPKAIRRELAKHVETMDEIIQREREMAESNRLIFEKLIASWEAAIKETQNVRGTKEK